MRVKFLVILYIFLILSKSFSYEIGGAMSLDYFNNPVIDSAPSPIQQQPQFIHNLNIGIFTLHSGIGIVEANYEFQSNGFPVFNDMYSGFYTLEFDLYTLPGLSFKLNDKVTLGALVGGGFRLPVLVKEDSDAGDGVNNAFSWFYSEYRYLFWSATIFSKIKLPLSDNTKLYLDFHYRDFIFRDNQWIIGATVGLLWQFN
ncbi:hypothetical protein EW093_09085 [Thiospirochaeta perfilievii]|uniref:Uncharacterized protein n=1 Tax=Thiospirochaeta perfilievii TaxID=252967 RepID=A0A5C1QBF1_9SPIO|nr:hypothetical protein [Thiospirochaeta perfilievii]QEN04851.1 hypothetical protein EW093_09085 [Thiospirochaeta perfilievii]